MFLDLARPHDFRIGANRNFPEVEQARSRKTGVLRCTSLIQQAAPGISVTCAAGNFYDLSSFQLHSDLRKGLRKMAGGPCYNSRGIFSRDDRRHRMTEEMAIARCCRKTVARTVVILVPVGPATVSYTHLTLPTSDLV